MRNPVLSLPIFSPAHFLISDQSKTFIAVLASVLGLTTFSQLFYLSSPLNFTFVKSSKASSTQMPLSTQLDYASCPHTHPLSKDLSLLQSNDFLIQSARLELHRYSPSQAMNSALRIGINDNFDF